MEKQKDCFIAARIPKTLKGLLSRIIAVDAHLNESDFVRDAIREKIQRDAPELYAQLFKEPPEDATKGATLVIPPCFTDKKPAPGYRCDLCEVYALCAAAGSKIRAQVLPEKVEMEA